MCQHQSALHWRYQFDLASMYMLYSQEAQMCYMERIPDSYVIRQASSAITTVLYNHTIPSVELKWPVCMWTYMIVDVEHEER